MTPRWNPAHRKVRDAWGTRQWQSGSTPRELNREGLVYIPIPPVKVLRRRASFQGGIYTTLKRCSAITPMSAMEKLESFFRSLPQTIYWPSELAAIFQKHRSLWKLPHEMTFPSFVTWLQQKRKLTKIRLTSPRYPEIMRYAWGLRPSPVLVALSTKRESYFSHGSALWVHGIGGNGTELYVNQEQREKPPNDASSLTQESVNRVFKNNQRQTKLIYQYEKERITIVNGKHTNRLGVVPRVAPTGEPVEVTCIERSLIDATVRPVYAGGVSGVLAAFKAARSKVSIKKLVTLLETLDYTYPYHQAIGFYLKRSGYSGREQELLRKMGFALDFYLSHGIKDPQLDGDWRCFYPRGLK
jgi:hypothetical protein